MSLGLKRGTVQLEPHDKQWDDVAAQTIKTLKSILGDDAIDIQHIGSTAIPAIKAKPIIDIAVGVTDFEKIMSHNEQLEKEGIFYRGSDVEHQVLYVMGDMEADIRTHHIHIVKWNGTEWKNYIHFRDYLNANENVALQYEKLKEDDALYSLDNAINKMRLYLKENEEYKNQMYQNISHDFKTPITVMKSYIEAYEDKVLSEEKTMSVIKEQINKLEIKVHSLLYLNKINYIKDKNQKLSDTYDVSLILTSSLEKFKMARPDVNFKINIDTKNTVFRGSKDMWEAIIDNIMGNFIRYANKEISITLKNNKIIFYNDGPNIDNNILNNIFTPYEKGINGIFGLGLSIVKKTLQLLDYDIFVKNEKKGIKFIIGKKK